MSRVKGTVKSVNMNRGKMYCCDLLEIAGICCLPDAAEERGPCGQCMWMAEEGQACQLGFNYRSGVPSSLPTLHPCDLSFLSVFPEL